MSLESQFKTLKEREIEQHLEEHFGAMEPLGTQYYQLEDGRRLMFSYANGNTWFSVREKYLEERLAENDLYLFVWTDEVNERMWIFGVPLGEIVAAFERAELSPTKNRGFYNLHLMDETEDGHRFRQLDLDLDRYLILETESTLTGPRLGLDDPPDSMRDSGLPEDKLRRLLRWGLEGRADQGDNFDFVMVRRRLAAIQPVLELLSSKEEEFTEAGLQTVLESVHSAQRQKTNILRHNTIEDVRSELSTFLTDHYKPVEKRIGELKLKHVGKSIAGELVAWHDPERYPLHNGCAEEGLRFFGYDPGQDYADFREAFLQFRGVYEATVGRLHADVPINMEIDQLFNQVHKGDLRQNDEEPAGRAARAWRITLPDQKEYGTVWPTCLEQGIAAVGLAEVDPDNWQLREFSSIRPGDWVVAFLRQKRIGGIGRVLEAYDLDSELEIPPAEDYWDGKFLRRLRVEWFERELSVESLSPSARNRFFGGTVQTIPAADFDEIRSHFPETLESDDPDADVADAVEYTVDDFLRNAYQADRRRHDEVTELLREKGQVVFYGPPGTGKTFLARELAKSLIGTARPEESRLQIVQFHPAYSYEEFIEGIRPESKEHDGRRMVEYPIRSGSFAQFCRNAEEQDGPCVFVIDEINRGNIASIFGELMYALEYRDDAALVRLPYSGKTFRIPRNVYIIGTMNTADRSISLMDFALRRRFHFIRCPADVGILERWVERNEPDMPYLLPYFRLLKETIDEEDYQIGVSYFMDQALTEERLRRIWRRSIEPYLETYFVGDPGRMAELRWDSPRMKRLRRPDVPSSDG